MRVAFNGTALIGPLTGVGQYAFQLAQRIAAMDETELFVFYATSFERGVRPRRDSFSVPARRLVRSFIPYAYDIVRRYRQRRFTRGAKSIRFDLYHEPNFLAYEFDGPLVLTVHDLSWIRYPETHPPQRVRAMHRYFEPGLRRAQLVLTDSEFVRQEVIEQFGIAPSRIRAIPIGLDPLFRPMRPDEAGPVLAAHGLQFGQYLLSVGTLEPRKNLERTVRAYALLPAPLRAQYPLVIVGASGWRDRGIGALLGPLVASGEAKVLGYLQRDDLVAVTAGASALVYPSIYEGFGLPPLEAMGCGVPVIASHASSLPEVVGDTGILVDPFDVDSISAGMRRMLEDSEARERLAPGALERAASFSWDACAQRTHQAYRDVLASSR